MSTLSCVDAAYPSGISGGPYDIVAFYIGGDTPHIWTHEEINARPERYRLPIFVRSNPPGPGADVDARDALAQLSALGAPRGSMVAWDSETSQRPDYIREVYNVIHAAGYHLLDYGSVSDVFANQNPENYYWAADWTDVRHIDPGSVMTQYISFKGYDESSAQAGLPFWDTHPAPVKPPPVTTGGKMRNGQLLNRAFEVFPKGSYQHVMLYRDFTSPQVPVKIRVAAHSASHGYQIFDVPIETSIPLTVDFAQTDIDCVSLRLDSGPYPVGYCLI
jgi:hypothetical protein